MEFRGPVLAATDLSEDADAALRQGHAIAADAGVPFSVCHVLPEAFRVRVLFPQDAGIDVSVQTELERKAREVIGDRIDVVLGSAVSSPIPVEIESGTAHAGILEIAERVGAGLIVVGPGATAVRVARSAACPVLIARPSPAGGAVLGATDFSDPSLPAIHMAAAEAKRRGVRLRVLHCLDVDQTSYLATASVPGIVPLPPVPEPVIQQLESAARARLTIALTATGAPGETLVLRRRPAVGVIESSETPATALIVVGTRGRSGLSRLALGSVAEDVVTHAACSVMVVPLNGGAEHRAAT